MIPHLQYLNTVCQQTICLPITFVTSLANMLQRQESLRKQKAVTISLKKWSDDGVVSGYKIRKGDRSNCTYRKSYTLIPSTIRVVSSTDYLPDDDSLYPMRWTLLIWGSYGLAELCLLSEVSVWCVRGDKGGRVVNVEKARFKRLSAAGSGILSGLDWRRKKVSDDGCWDVGNRTFVGELSPDGVGHHQWEQFMLEAVCTNWSRIIIYHSLEVGNALPRIAIERFERCQWFHINY